MKKPKYSGDEIHDLLQQIKELEHNDTDQLSVVIEELSSYVLDRYNIDQGAAKNIILEVHLYIASRAHRLEREAKSLRSLARAFTKPMKELPKDLNHENKIISNIASWRLKLGK